MIKKYLLVLLMIALIVVSLSCGSSKELLIDKNITADEEVDSYGKPTTSPSTGTKIIATANTVYHGAFVGDEITEANVSAFETMSGEKLDVAVKFLAFCVIDEMSAFPQAEAQIMAKRNGVLFIKLEPWSWGVAGKPAYSLEDIISGKYDGTLRKFANGAKAYGKPVFVTFGHEMNGWYPWSGNPTLYIAAYRYVYNKVSKYGANNITWVWNPYLDSGNMMAYYPGSSYVDWVAVDGYNTEDYGAAWSSAEQLFAESISQLESLKKPVMIGELATDANNDYDQTVRKPEWLSTGMNYLCKKLTAGGSDNLIKGTVYFNVDKTEGGQPKDWAIDTLISQNSYKSAIASNKACFAKDIQIK